MRQSIALAAALCFGLATDGIVEAFGFTGWAVAAVLVLPVVAALALWPGKWRN